jgi:putative peptide zinc metalloprotease protein
VSESRGELMRLDTSEREPAYLLECSDGAKIRLSETAKTVLELRWSGRTFAEIAQDLAARGLRRCDGAEVEGYYDAMNVKLDALEAAGGGEIDPSFGFKRAIFSREATERIASGFTWMYSRTAVVIALSTIAVAAAAWIVGGHLAHKAKIDASSVGFGYALFFLSLFAHEFGHASACLRFGGRPGKIGLTVYIVLPALYSDVGSAWKLTRPQRVVVDLGGTYFHAVVGALYVLLYVATRWEPFAFATALIIVTAVFNLNPIFKFDGYWIVADALGVTNLSKQPARILRFIRDRLARRATAPLPWRAPTIAALTLYSTVATSMWAYFLVRLALALQHQVSALVVLALAIVHRGSVGSLADVRALALTCFGAVMTVYFVFRWVRRAWRTTRALHRASAPVPISTGDTSRAGW